MPPSPRPVHSPSFKPTSGACASRFVRQNVARSASDPRCGSIRWRGACGPRSPQNPKIEYFSPLGASPSTELGREEILRFFGIGGPRDEGKRIHDKSHSVVGVARGTCFLLRRRVSLVPQANRVCRTANVRTDQRSNGTECARRAAQEMDLGTCPDLHPWKPIKLHAHHTRFEDALFWMKFRPPTLEQLQLL